MMMAAHDGFRMRFFAFGSYIGGAWKTSTPTNTHGMGTERGMETHLAKTKKDKSEFALYRNQE